MESSTLRIESHILKALSHPARLHILTLLAGQEACVCHIQAVVGLRQASASQHLRELRRSHLIASRRHGAHVYYHVDDPRVPAFLENLLALVQAQDGRPKSATKLRLTPPRGQCKCPQCRRAGP